MKLSPIEYVESNDFNKEEVKSRKEKELKKYENDIKKKEDDEHKVIKIKKGEKKVIIVKENERLEFGKNIKIIKVKRHKDGSKKYILTM
jgi:hypothetical protein